MESPEPGSILVNLRRRWESFAETTSTHGVFNVSRGASIFSKIFWAASVAALAYLSAHNVGKTVRKYLDAETVVRTEAEGERHIAFPAVTVCNLNPFRKSCLEEDSRGFEGGFRIEEAIYEPNFNQTHLIKTMEIGMLQRNSSLDIMTNRLFDKIWIPFFAAIAPELAKKLGHQRNDSVLFCIFNNRRCEEGTWTQSFSMSYGNCMTFNGDKTNVSKSGNIGRNSGLSLILNAQVDEYLNRTLGQRGFVVRIHNQSETPLPGIKGLTLPLGVQTEIGFKKKRIVRLGKRKRGLFTFNFSNCLAREEDREHEDIFHGHFHPFETYSSMACQFACYQSEMLERENCTLPLYPLPSNKRTDGIIDVNKSRGCQSIWERSDSSGVPEVLDLCKIRCPDLCDKTAYDIESSMSPWPEDPWLEDMLNDWLESLAVKSLNNLAFLNVYPLETVVETIFEEPVIADGFELLSAIGGTMGLCLGMSVLSVIELLQFLASVLDILVRGTVRVSSIDFPSNAEKRPL